VLSIEVRLPFGSYEAAAADDWAAGEWPPHPARAFCALVAGAETDREWSALEWLEVQPPPQVWACDEVLPTASLDTYVVTNRTMKGGGNLSFPGRTNELRRKPKVNPAVASFAIVWPYAEPPEAISDALVGLAARVPYLGRSSGVALVDVDVGDAEARRDPRWQVFEPVELGAEGWPLRVPYAGFVAALRDAHARGARAWETCRSVQYAVRLALGAPPGRPDEPAPTPYPELVVFGFAPGVRLDGALMPRVTDAVRRAVLRRIQDHLDRGGVGGSIPPGVSGHGADGRPHVAFLALPDVGHGHADGHLLGVAVALPGLAAEERRAVLEALVPAGETAGLRRLCMARIGDLELRYDPSRTKPWGLLPERWRGPSTVWASATPVVLDRFPARRGALDDEVRRSCVHAGLPEPPELEVANASFVTGGVQLRPHQFVRRETPLRPYVHVRLRFPEAISGPVLLGSQRYLGLGLLVPIGDPR
jgi:CRISPR-associated protein Csb2